MFKFNFICQSVRNKLLFITGLGTTLVIAATLWGLYAVWSNNQEMLHIVKKHVAIKSELQEMVLVFGAEVQAWKNVLIRGKDEEKRQQTMGQG